MMLGHFRPTGAKQDNLSLMLEDLSVLEQTIREATARWDSDFARSTQRIMTLSEQAEAIRQDKLASALDALRNAQGKEYARRAPEKKFRPSTGMGTSVSDAFKTENRSEELNKLRAACRAPPDFSRIAQIAPGLDWTKKFSDPGFFYQEWERAENAKVEEAEKEKEAKKRDREKRKKEQVDGSGRALMPQLDDSMVKSAVQIPQKPQRPARQPSSISESAATLPPAARRSARPLSTAVTVAADGSVAPPPRPVRTDSDVQRRTVSVALPSQGSQHQLASASPVQNSIAPTPLPRPPRPRTVAIPPSAQLQPVVAPLQLAPVVAAPVVPVVATVAAATAASEPSGYPPAPPPRTSVLSPRKAPPPPAEFPIQLGSIAGLHEPLPVDSPSVQIASNDVVMSTQSGPSRPARPRPPPPPPGPQMTTTPTTEQPSEATFKLQPEAAPRPKRAQAPPPPATEQIPPPKRQPAPERVASPIYVPEEYVEQQTARSPVPATIVQNEQEEDTSPMVQSDDDPVLKKYLMMQKMNLPQGAIEQAMIRDKVDPAKLFGANAIASLSAPATKLVIPVRKVLEEQERASPPPSNSGNALMDEILKGKALKKVVTPPSPTGPASTSGGGMASDLMQGIRAGRDKLRSVVAPPPVPQKAAPSALEGGGVASILARRIAIIGEQGSDTDSAGSEWDESDDE